MLGLAGAVAKNDFVRLCENAHPRTRERLTQRLKYTRKVFLPGEEEREEANRRVFFDFTFSPPKSVSIAALVVGDARIFDAHREAVKMAVAELEQFAATRIREAGCNSDRHTGNIVAALFEHETSRALDPHLHTHCIVFNATRDETENRWKALQNHQMLVAQKYVENVYYHELSRALGSIGYTVENLARGDFRVTEINPTLCERFSKRHREIDEQTSQFLADHPDKIDGNVHDVREHLAHKLRSRKLRDLPADRLRALWKSQLTSGDRAALRLPLAPAPQATMTSTHAVSCAEEHLFDRRSIVHEHDLWRYALEFARGSTLTLADLKRETSVRDYIRERDGRLTRKDVLSREWKIVQIAKNGVGHHAPFAASYAMDPADLAEDQIRAFKALLASRDFVTLFRGGAGTGKSYVLREVQRAFDWAGAETLVLAPQRQQVIDLEKDGLRHTQTVEALQRKSVPNGAVVVVDEAGQIGGSQMLALLELVRDRRGRIILSGDTRQHGPVGASDALRAIERYSGLRPAELNEIRRQDPRRAKTELERAKIRQYLEAVKAAADGDISESFSELEALGAIIECRPDGLNDRLVQAYLDLVSRGKSALVVSQTRAEVSALNECIRLALRSCGGISGTEHRVTALDSVDLTSSQKLDPRFYPAGHVVIFNRKLGPYAKGAHGRMIAANRAGIVVEAHGKVRLVKAKHADHLTVCARHALAVSSQDRLQLKANAKALAGEALANGEVVTVKAVRASGEIELTDGRALPANYRQFVRGYAVTSYSSQGKTVDHVLLGDSAVRAATNAQQWYVSISRGRKSIRIFTPNKA